MNMNFNIKVIFVTLFVDELQCCEKQRSRLVYDFYCLPEPMRRKKVGIGSHTFLSLF